jgi:hypothetical protein
LSFPSQGAKELVKEFIFLFSPGGKGLGIGGFNKKFKYLFLNLSKIISSFSIFTSKIQRFSHLFKAKVWYGLILEILVSNSKYISNFGICSLSFSFNFSSILSDFLFEEINQY